MAIARKKIQKIGNSRGVVLTADFLRDAGISPDAEVIILGERGRIVITALDPDFDAQVAAADRFVAQHPNALRKLGE